ncbi:hypothetical protein [Nocardia australiensis]|uniref:hypothetical protein n=1 Tax=Nocardia australiensis TaxID=2887191 RepID=UPI001D153AA3|nr:hypothetical protein [Nocardia australiensis]
MAQAFVAADEAVVGVLSGMGALENRSQSGSVSHDGSTGTRFLVITARRNSMVAKTCADFGIGGRIRAYLRDLSVEGQDHARTIGEVQG